MTMTNVGIAVRVLKPIGKPAGLPVIDPSSFSRVVLLPIRGLDSDQVGSVPLARFHYDVEPTIPWKYRGNLEPRPVTQSPDVTEASPQYSYVDAGNDPDTALALAFHRAEFPTRYNAAERQEDAFPSAQAVLQATDGRLYVSNLDGPMWTGDIGPTPMDGFGWQVSGVERQHPTLKYVVGTNSYVKFD
jgi:hypothetical protein